MTQAAYPANGDVPSGTLFPTDGKRPKGTLFLFDAHGEVNRQQSASGDTRRLQQMQKELRLLTLPQLRGIRKEWSKPPLQAITWIQELVPYLDGLIKERTLMENVARAKTPPQQLQKVLLKKPTRVEWSIKQPPMPPSISATAVDATSMLVMEMRDLREAVEVLNVRIAAGLPPSVERTSKPLPPPRQHAKGKKRRLIGPRGELAAVTRPYLEYAIQHHGAEMMVITSVLQVDGINLKRFQSSLAATASYFYGRRSMTTRLVRNSAGVETGVAFTFIGSTKPIRPFNATKRADTQPISIDQSTPT